jgi:hypothetical protein
MDSANSSNNANNGLVLENDKRLASLTEFIQWLENQIKNDGADFDRLNLDCTKGQLFDHLRRWEESRVSKKDRVWDVKGWSACRDLWSKQERKNICDVADNRRGQEKRESAYEKFIY